MLSLLLMHVNECYCMECLCFPGLNCKTSCLLDVRVYLFVSRNVVDNVL